MFDYRMTWSPFELVYTHTKTSNDVDFRLRDFIDCKLSENLGQDRPAIGATMHCNMQPPRHRHPYTDLPAVTHRAIVVEVGTA
jgi:hypothetical protein